MSAAPHGSTCRTCGAPLEPGAVFCADCGARVVAGSPEPFVPSPYSVPMSSTAPAPVVPPVSAGPSASPSPAAATLPALPPVPAAPAAADPARSSRRAAPPTGLAPPPPPGPTPSTPPPPSRRTAAPPTGAYPVAPGAVAPIGSRALAYAIDGLVLLVAVGIGYVVVAATGNLPAQVSDPGATRIALLLPALLGLLVAIGQWVAEARTGATVGNATTGIRTVSYRTGRPAGLLAILVRQLVVAAGFLVLLVGEWVVVVSGTWDSSPAQRGWHDKAAGTLVLRARSVERASGVAASTAWNTAVARTMGDAPLEAPGFVPAAPGAGAASDVAPEPPSGPTAAAVEPPPGPSLVTGAPGVPSRPAPPAASDLPGAPATPEAAGDEFLVPLVPVRRVPDPPATTRRAARLAETAAAGEVITGMPGTSPSTPPPPARAQPVIDVPHTRPDSSPTPRITQATSDLGELEHTRLRPSAAEPRVVAPVALRLSFDTGERVDVTGDGLVGRSPAAEEGVGHLVPVDDPARSISKTHLAFGLDGAGDRLWVVDRGSTNGTVLVAPDGRSTALPAGTRATVAAGWTIRFGQRSALVERR